MTKIAYSVSLIDGNSIIGVASKLFIKDVNTILTISDHHAPLVGTLSHGSVVVYDLEGASKEYGFEDAFLNCHDNTVTLTVLN